MVEDHFDLLQTSKPLRFEKKKKSQDNWDDFQKVLPRSKGRPLRPDVEQTLILPAARTCPVHLPRIRLLFVCAPAPRAVRPSGRQQARVSMYPLRRIVDATFYRRGDLAALPHSARWSGPGTRSRTGTPPICCVLTI